MISDVDCSSQKHCQKAHYTDKFKVCNRRNNINSPGILRILLLFFTVILCVGVLRLHNSGEKKNYKN